MSKVAKKPGKVVHNIKGWNGKPQEIEVAFVHEDFYAEQFADEGDLLKCSRTPVLFGDEMLFEGFTNKDQAAIAEKLSKFFAQYSAWVSTRAEGKEGPK